MPDFLGGQGRSTSMIETLTALRRTIWTESGVGSSLFTKVCIGSVEKTPQKEQQ